MLCAPPVADLAAIFAVPCCLAEITAAGYALYLPREAGCTDGIRAVLAPFHGHFSTCLLYTSTRINDSEENLEDYFSKLIGGGGIA